MTTEDTNSPKYEDIITTAHQLFWKHGIRRVSIEEVCEKADVSKMTFYRFFSNKTDLAKVIIDRMFEENIKKFRSVMHADIPFEEKVKKFVLMKFEGTENISQEFVHDVYKNKKLGLMAHWQEKATILTKEVYANFTEAQKKGWIRSDLNIQLLMAFNAKLADMVDDPALLQLAGGTQNLIMQLTNLFFYGIFQHHEK